MAATRHPPPPDARSVLSRPADPPDLVLRWADVDSHGDDGVVDAYLPTRGVGRPPVVLLHGGFWREEHDRRHVRPLAVALRGTGRAVLVPEYRRGLGWPAIAADVESLRRQLPRFLSEVGTPARAGTDGPVLVGHSAGGQLALWWALGVAVRGLVPSRVVALAPVADLARALQDDLGDGAVRALLGGGPDERPHAYASADVAARLRAGEPTAPVVVLHGTADAQVPVVHSRALAADADAVTLRELPGTDHFALIDPLTPAWPHLLAALA